MSSAEMVELFFSFVIPIFVMNVIFFGLGLMMEPVRFSKKEEDLPSDKEKVSNERAELRKLFDEFRQDVLSYDEFITDKELELEHREQNILEMEIGVLDREHRLAIEENRRVDEMNEK